MKYVRSAYTVIALLAISATPSFAMVKPVHGGTMPKCAVSDQIVMVDPTAKTYKVLEKSSTAPTVREISASQMKANAARIKRGLRPMCKSKADAMGARMIPGAMKS